MVFHGITLYGGMQAAENYGSAALGVGKDLGALGAISFDVTHARANFSHDDTETGQSYRFLYSKRFDDTDTSLRPVGYRYSTEGYYTLNEWASRRNSPEDFGKQVTDVVAWRNANAVVGERLWQFIPDIKPATILAYR